jgi:hypothetical protein
MADPTGSVGATPVGGTLARTGVGAGLVMAVGAVGVGVPAGVVVNVIARRNTG